MGTPEHIAELPESYTGQYLAPLLQKAKAPRTPAQATRKKRAR
jgi:excinuclease ABC subunit A